MEEWWRSMSQKEKGENQRVKTQSRVMQTDSKDYTQICTGTGDDDDDDDDYVQLNSDP